MFIMGTIGYFQWIGKNQNFYIVVQACVNCSFTFVVESQDICTPERF